MEFSVRVLCKYIHCLLRNTTGMKGYKPIPRRTQRYKEIASIVRKLLRQEVKKQSKELKKLRKNKHELLSLTLILHLAEPEYSEVDITISSKHIIDLVTRAIRLNDMYLDLIYIRKERSLDIGFSAIVNIAPELPMLPGYGLKVPLRHHKIPSVNSFYQTTDEQFLDLSDQVKLLLYDMSEAIQQYRVAEQYTRQTTISNKLAVVVRDKSRDYDVDNVCGVSSWCFCSLLKIPINYIIEVVYIADNAQATEQREIEIYC